MLINSIERSDKFKRSYKKLPVSIQKKFSKQIKFLIRDFHHPSIRTKKLTGAEDIWEARVDRKYRFLFQITNNILRLLLIGPHDEGLGKK